MELYKAFAQHWTKPALIDAAGGQEFSYQDLWTVIQNGRKILENQCGLTKGQVVCLMMANSVELAVLYFSALLAGIVVAPLDPEKSQQEIDEILGQLKPNLIISDCEVVADQIKIIKIDSFIHELLEIQPTSIDQLSSLDQIDYEALFLITFTSGSTGQAKGVMHSFGNLARTSLAFAKKFNFGPNNIWYHNLPMSYMAGILNQLIKPLLTGGCVVIGPRFTVAQAFNFWDIPMKYNVNTFWFVPTMLTLLLKLDRNSKAIAYIQKQKIIGCVGTAPLKLTDKQAFQDRYGISLYASYGLSETLFISTQAPDQTTSTHSVGALLEGVHLSFAQDEEILINVPWIFLGYLQGDIEQYFDAARYKSGDLGALDENSLLHITGRKKELIIKGGLNISPKKIEDTVMSNNFFDECVIIGLPDEIMGEKIACFYVSDKPYDDALEKNVGKAVIHHLGNDYCIDTFIQLDAIPKHSNGKIDKISLKKNYSQRAS